jgi:hypothetical protein
MADNGQKQDPLRAQHLEVTEPGQAVAVHIKARGGCVGFRIVLARFNRCGLLAN